MPSLTDIIKEIDQTRVKHVNNIAALEGLDLTGIEAVFVSAYHNISDTSGGGPFVKATGRHNGGTFIDPNRAFPTDWNDQAQLEDWFADSGVDVVGLKRVYEGAVSVDWFGTIGKSDVDDSYSIHAAGNLIKLNNGGYLNFNKPDYYVKHGGQDFTPGAGYTSRVGNIIDITDCTNTVIIDGNGAKIHTMSGLRFGTFDVNTGDPLVTTSPYYGDGGTHIGHIVFVALNKKVRVKNLDLDGNSQGSIIGGLYGDNGRQLSHRGLFGAENDDFLAENVKTYNFCLDGVQLYRSVSTFKETIIYPHTLINIDSQYNGRQGLSWTGGNNLTCINSIFSNTGKGATTSAPASGVDIEAEGSVISNVLFIGCTLENNNGPCLLVDSGVIKDVSLIGCKLSGVTNASIWGPACAVKATDCNIEGAIANIHDDSVFTNCKLSMDVSSSKYDELYGSFMELDGSNASFNNCQFITDINHKLPYSNGTIYNYCTFYESPGATGVFYTRGKHTGSIFTYSSTGDFSGSTFYGDCRRNGVQVVESSVVKGELSVFDPVLGVAKRFAIYNNPTEWASLVGGAIQGDIVFSSNPTAGANVGWVCVTGGNPGIWKAFGRSDA